MMRNCSHRNFIRCRRPELADQSPYTAWLRRGDTGHRAIYLEPSLYPARKRREPVMLGAVAKMAT
jgi:hypothetical protein